MNQDRLEKKKNREKRRRSEVNERFEEVGVMLRYMERSNLTVLCLLS